MKKLLIALTAVATGLFASTAVADAEALPTGVGFESLTAGDELVPDSYWTASADPEAKMTVTAWNGEFPADITRPAVPGEDNEVNYLSVKTKFGNPLIRRAFTAGAPTVANGKIFFDSMVKFTATDEDPTTEYENAKLIVYVKDNSEDDTTTETTTNLMVKAQNGTYDLGTIDVDVWHRLTIKAVKAFTSGDELAFTVYVDETPKAATSAAFADTSSLTTEAKGINAAKRLFPAINACTSITEVGFDGQGFIDDLVFADTVDGTWANENAFAITMGDNITSYKWTVKSGGVVVDSATATDDASIPAVANMTVEITEVQFAAGNWELAADETSNCEFENGVFKNFGTGSASATLIANDKTPRVSVTIGAETVTYPTVGKAFDAVNALVGADAVTVAFDKTYFADGIQLGLIETQDGSFTEGTLSSGAAVTLDLAGCTIIGPDSYEGCAIESVGDLTIVDTVGGGKIVPSSGGAVYYMADLSIGGGIFDGAIVADAEAGDLTITGGSFDYATNSNGAEFKFKNVLTTDYVVAKDDADDPKYWVVSPAPKAGVVVETTHATVDGVKSGDQLAAGATINFTVEADTNYTLKSVKIGDEEQGTTGLYEYEVTADDVAAKTLNITAVAEATEWTITYYNDDDVLNPTVFAEEKYSVEEGTLNSGAKQGYTFNGWSDEEGNPVTTLEGKTGDLELFGSWTIDQAFGGGTGDVANPYVITTEAHLVELQTKVAAGDTFEGKYFQQQNDIQLTAAWKCIGTATIPFKGNYDGQNYTISNLRFAVDGDTKDGAYTYLGFFRYVYGGTIENLKIEMAVDGDGVVNGFDLTNKGDVSEWGGAAFVGQAMTNAVLRNLTAVSGTIAGSHNVAGIAIKAFPSVQILDCTNFVDLVAGYTKAAGIVVFTQKDTLPVGTPEEMTLTISGCRNVGTITATDWVVLDKDSKPTKWAGQDGLAGIIDYIGGDVIVAIENCSSEGAIDVTAQANKVPVGSIAAYARCAGLKDLGGNTTTLVDIPSAVDHASKATTIDDGSFIYAVEANGVATFVKTADLDLSGAIPYKVMAPNAETVTLMVGETIKFDEAIASVTVAPDDAEKNKVEKKQMAGTTTYLYTCSAKGPDIPVDPDQPLSPAGEANAAAVVEEFGSGLDAWVADVYGEGGKIPASKLNATTAALIAAAKEFNLPIMTEAVKVEVEAAADGFTFKIVDGTPINVQKANLQKLIKYAAALETGFGESDGAVGLENNGTSFDAKFTTPDAAAGFMKVDMTVK